MLEVPSSIVPVGKNHLLNPSHADWGKIELSESAEQFIFDGRLKKIKRKLDKSTEAVILWHTVFYPTSTKASCYKVTVFIQTKLLQNYELFTSYKLFRPARPLHCYVAFSFS